MKMMKLGLCSYVDCADILCLGCPADKYKEKEFFPRAAHKWWIEHWDFSLQKPILKFEKWDLVLVSDDDKHWYPAVFMETNSYHNYIASREINGRTPQPWAYCKPWKGSKIK